MHRLTGTKFVLQLVSEYQVSVFSQRWRWRVTRQPCDRLNFTRQCHRVSELLSASRSQYYSDLVKENKHDQRKLFGTVYKLLHLDPDPKYPPH